MRCYSCLQEIDSNRYCLACRKKLFTKTKIQPLQFHKDELYDIDKLMINKMSIAGMQDKFSLFLKDSATLRPASKDGQFILKPKPKRFTHYSNLHDICANEHLSMQLSDQVFNIPTASNGLIHFSDGELAYIVKRFDYQMDENHEMQKCDQEDFASVLEKTQNSDGKDYKYSSSYEAIAKEIKRVIAASIPAIEDFYNRIVFNYLIGNADAHLKNFSIIKELGRKDYTLTPNYNLLYTGLHSCNEEKTMALNLFEENSRGIDFREFARTIGIKEKRIDKLFTHIKEKQKPVNTLIDRSFLSDESKIAYKENFEKRFTSLFSE